MKALIAHIVMLFPAIAIAAPETTPEKIQGGSVLGQVLLGLFFVTALIYFLAWCVKKFTNGNFMQAKGMTIVSAMALGTREKAILLEVENKKILVGIAPGSITTLHVFDSETKHEVSSEKSTKGANRELNNETYHDNVEPVGIFKQHLAQQSGKCEKSPAEKTDFAGYIKEVLKNGMRR